MNKVVWTIKRGIKYPIILISLCSIYSILILLSFSIPQDWIEDNRIASLRMIQSEGDWPQPIYHNTTLDNYSDKLMFNLIRPTNNTLIQGFDIYSRYWNGWTILLRPMLLVGNLSVIRSIHESVFIFMAAIVCIVLIKRTNILYAGVFFCALIPIQIGIVAPSMQYSHIYFVTFAFITYLLWKKRTREQLFVAFFIVGSVTNFIDLLTTPLITYGISITILIVAYRNNTRISIIDWLTCTLLWLIGYGTTWVSKWVISTMITRRNVFHEALSQANHRITGNLDNTHIKPSISNMLDLILQSFAHKADLIFIIALMIIFLVFAMKYRSNILNNYRNKLYSSTLLLLTACTPFIWTFSMLQHTQQHSWFTYRILTISAISLLSIIWIWVFGSNKKDQFTPISLED